MDITALGHSAYILSMAPDGDGEPVHILVDPWLSDFAVGDLMGDGAPLTYQAEDSVVVAWLRPWDASIRVVAGDSSGWTELAIVPAVGAVGTPQLVSVEGRFGVVWQRVADGREEIVLSALLPPGEPVADEIILSEGRFLGLEAQDGRATLLVLQDDGSLEAQWIVFNAAIHRPPIDILRSEVFILDQLEGTFQQTLPSVHRGSVNTLLAWWPTPQQLRFVEVTADGPGAVVHELTHPGRASHPQVLVRRALKQLAQE